MSNLLNSAYFGSKIINVKIIISSNVFKFEGDEYVST